MLLTVENAYQVDLQGRQLGRDGLAIHDSEIPHTYTAFDFGDSCVCNLLSSARRLTRGRKKWDIRTTMSTAPYFSNASSKRDSWSSQLTTLHLVATAFLEWKTRIGTLNLEIVTSGRQSKMTHPPSLIMVETTACAPGTSKSPITTLALDSNIIHGRR